MKNKYTKYYLEFTVFFSGAFVMAYEILASRILGPSMGTSIQVWTIIIGIFLVSLSIGYVFGGKLADKKASHSLLGKIILSAAFFILLSGFIYQSLLLNISENLSILPATTLASILLFSLPGFLLGMVSPFAVRLKLYTLDNTGSTVGSLYSLSTIGSILGTILTGFYLIPHFAVSTIIMGLSVSLIVISLGLFVFHKNTD